MEKKELELYVHIPFCVKKCAYCDFLSAPASEEERSAYVNALLREIIRRGKDYSDYEVVTVFIGGGTPSVLQAQETADILSALKENFQIREDAEITMEVNPGTVTAEKAAKWKKCGVNRISIGLQSTDDMELKLLGRIHTYETFAGTWKTVRDTGFDNVNIDLISAVPGQTALSWEKTLRTVAALEPEHISAYSLIIEEGTPFFQQYGQEGCHAEPSLPDEDEERRIYKETEKILNEYGYNRYEISNYAKPGKECRHNLGYWERREYLGLGLGASSLIGECRFRNPSSLDRYYQMTSENGTENLMFFMEEKEELSINDRMEEFMFLGLRKTEGITEADFKERFGKNIRQVYEKQLSDLSEKGLVVCENGRIRLTDRGTDISNYVFCEFMF